MLLAAGANADVPRNDGATALWIASQMGHDHVVKVLLSSGAYVDAVRNDGATPLFKASHKGHHAVVHELLKYRPSLNVLPVSLFDQRGACSF
jgi:ankyrin repeat protein